MSKPLFRKTLDNPVSIVFVTFLKKLCVVLSTPGIVGREVSVLLAFNTPSLKILDILDIFGKLDCVVGGGGGGCERWTGCGGGGGGIVGLGILLLELSMFVIAVLYISQRQTGHLESN
jgi:hypothetical protein